MKIRNVFVAVAVVMCLVLPSVAKANRVNVKGDILKEGKLLIDVDWTVDSSKYQGLSRDAIRQKVQDEMWGQILPKLVDATKGFPVSFDKSNFILVKEYTDLVKKRTDGSKLYSMKVQVEFITTTAQGASQPTFPRPAISESTAAKEQSKKNINRNELKQRWDNEL